MPFQMTLLEARTDLISLAAIDGKTTGANAHHSVTSLNRTLNRKYRMLMSRVSQLGLPQFLESTAALSVPVQTVGEDYIEIPMPALTSEVIGVDVRSVNNYWAKLDAMSFEQRRDIGLGLRNRNVPWYLQGKQAPSGIGWWAINKAPKTVNTTTITAGTIALWPPNLSGTYKLHSVQAWTDLTADGNIFLLYEAWDEWFINSAVMAVCQRDKNKADLYVQARDSFNAADALIVAQAARLQRGGFVVPTGYGGIEL